MKENLLAAPVPLQFDSNFHLKVVNEQPYLQVVVVERCMLECQMINHVVLIS